MDLFEELEQMALNVADETSEPETPSDDTVQRWQKLFGYSHTDAITMVERHRSDISRKRITNEHWEVVREKFENQGYDREAYEHELSRGGEKVKAGKKETPTHIDNGRYLVKFEGLVTSKLIQELSASTKPVEVMRGSGDDEDADFCVVNATIKESLLEKSTYASFRPTIVRLPEPAPKEFSSISKYPTLGIDTTLPQYRPSNEEKEFPPAQDQYPVWYFFYGTLADAAVLTNLLGLGNEPMLWPAVIRGGILKTWAGKYRALVDGPECSVVEGWAYEVQSKEHEESLRAYETSNYEVVRCMVEVGYRLIPGCTFRFVGKAGD